MGHTVTATCACGFASDHLMIGGGRMNFQTNRSYPARCTTCRDIVTVNLLEEALACPQCDGTEVAPYNRPELLKTPGREVSNWNMGRALGNLTLTDGKYLCPKCGKFELSFGRGGTLFD